MRFSIRECLQFLCCVVALGFGSIVSAQQNSTPALQVASDVVDGQLRIGIEHEQNQRWLEAIQHYEIATRKFPDHAELKRRLLISRLHYDVLRRCLDVTMLDNLKQASVQDVLELYSEVLARLEMSYVDPLEMTQLVRGGTAYLEVALTEPKFVDAFLNGQNPQVIEQFRTNIHRHTLARPINNRFEARTIVANAAATAEKQIGLSPTITVMQFVFGAVGLLDPYSSFLSTTELNEVESQIEGNFVGLGIALKPHEVPLYVLSVIPNGPAMEAGLQPGDSILEIGSSRCEDVGAERAADLLRGPPQSHVRLLIARQDGTTFERVVARRRVDVPSIENASLIDTASGIAYLKITSFQKTTANELDEALWSLHRQGMQNLIIDLRGNPGGWLDAAVAVADRFIQEGGIVSTRGKNGIENQNYTANRSGTWQVPLILLIDHESASASEILAGAINDNRRGLLVGTTSYGKGSVQGLFHTKALSSGIRLTVSKFYSPAGAAISERGVQPNIPVETDAPGERLTAKPVLAGDGAALMPADIQADKVLQVAIEQARTRGLTAQVSRN
ncbi:MAG: S41 family peptidase [Pirellulaceae bacterium]|nr:S41 family peptidase [Pirellulaceae bacterium]